MTKTGDQAGWKVIAHPSGRPGHIQAVVVGIYDSFMDADQAASEYFRSMKNVDCCTIEKHYEETENEDDT